MTHSATLLSRLASALLASAVVCGTALVACGQTAAIVPPKEPDACKLQLLTMTVIASPRLNLAENGDSRPVQLRIYQLANDVRLNNSDFEQIWKSDKKSLQDSLIKVEELSIYPGSRTEVKFERDSKALIVGGVALFRSPKGRSWYTTFELPAAPGQGNCGTPLCTGPNCKDGGGPPLNPKYVLWLENSRTDTGEDHLDEFPEGERTRELALPSSGPMTLPDIPTDIPTEVPEVPKVPKGIPAPAALQGKAP